jgi:hypothetical protein
MSECGAYRKHYLRLWRHSGFLALTPLEKLLGHYVLFGPQTNRLGLYCFSMETAAIDFRTSATALRRAFLRVCRTFGWHFDATTHVIFVPSWWEWNLPANPNILKDR